MNNYIDDFRLNLKHYRELKNWSQSELAIQANSSNGQIGNIEAGKSQPSLDLIIRIAEALEIHPADLFLRDSSTLQNRELYSRYNGHIQYCEVIPDPQKKAVFQLAKTLAESSPAYYSANNK